jgi:uncharacterized protein YciI
MLYVIHCIDKPGKAEVRAANRIAHLGYLTTYGEKVVAAGPTLSEDGETMTGSLLILDFAGREEAEEFVAGDPYTMAELFETVTIQPWKKVFPQA